MIFQTASQVLSVFLTGCMVISFAVARVYLTNLIKGK